MLRFVLFTLKQKNTLKQGWRAVVLTKRLNSSDSYHLDETLHLNQLQSSGDDVQLLR